MIKAIELDETLASLDQQSGEWLNGPYLKNCEACTTGETSQRFLSLAAALVASKVREGGDLMTPVVGLAATMLEAGYKLGRKHSEVETLNSWMELQPPTT